MRDFAGSHAADSTMFTSCGMGDHGFADCGVSCEHLPVPASGDSSGLTDHAPVATAVAGFVRAVGVLAYESDKGPGLN